MGRTKSHKKNIACLESLWDGNIESRLSVVPLLELASRRGTTLRRLSMLPSQSDSRQAMFFLWLFVRPISHYSRTTPPLPPTSTRMAQSRPPAGRPAGAPGGGPAREEPGPAGTESLVRGRSRRGRSDDA